MRPRGVLVSRRKNYASLEDALENGEGIERPFLCPVHEDTNPSASVNVDKGVWYCYSCHASGRADRKGGAKALTNEMKAFVELLDGDQKYVTHPPRWMDLFDGWGTHPYWINRFGVEASKRWRLGIHPTTGAPTYPVMNFNGNCAGVVQRTGGKPKYRYPVGVPMSRMLFGFNRKAKVRRFIVVEGAADCIAVSEAIGSISDTGIQVVASYGAGLHQPQVALINMLDPQQVTLGFDDDKAGERAKNRPYGLTSSVDKVHWGAKDPGELDSDGIIAALGMERAHGHAKSA